MRPFLFVIAIVWLLLPGIPRAAEIAGQDDPRFQAALQLWLADDDAAAVPEFATLAGEGNRAAQVLLGIIEAVVPLQGPWLVGLTRAERIALMRQPGGLSGRNWMEAAAVDTPLAAAWFALWRGTDRDEPAIAREFAALGEDRAVRMTLMAMSMKSRQGFAAMADDPIYPPSLRFLIWNEWAGDPSAETRIAEGIAALAPGDPQAAVVTGQQPGPVERAAWLAASAPAAPLRAFCSAACPESVPGCLDAAFDFHNGGPDLADFGSPVESLVPTATWNATARGRAVVLRRTLPADPVLREHRLAELTALDACFGAALAAEAASFAH